jgi:beta-lactam-binding protein with PASTA domain
VPKVVGLSLRRAQALLGRIKLDVSVTPDGAKAGRVVSQSVHWDVAAKPGMKITLVVAAG